MLHRIYKRDGTDNCSTFIPALLAAALAWRWWSRVAERSGVGRRVLPTPVERACVAAVHARWAREGLQGALVSADEMREREGEARDLRREHGSLAGVRASRDEDYLAGRSAGRGGLWRVRRVVDVRRPVARRGRQLEVLIEWEGEWGAAQREWRDVTACNDTCKRLARGLEVAKYGAVDGGAGGTRGGRKRGRGGGGGGPRVRTRAARRRGEVESSGPGAD